MSMTCRLTLIKRAQIRLGHSAVDLPLRPPRREAIRERLAEKKKQTKKRFIVQEINPQSATGHL